MKQAKEKGSKAVGGPVRSRRFPCDLVLTPATYRRLDLIARKHGHVITVVPADQMGNNWGRVNAFADSLYEDITAPQLRGVEFQTIEIASRISIEKFRQANRPEIDLTAVPKSKIWDYVVWHEIGHLRDNFDLLGPQLDRDFSDDSTKGEWIRAHRVVIEVIADRFAWAAIGGGRKLPVRSNPPVDADFISEWITRLDLRYGRRQRKDRSLSSEPFTFVPTRHMKSGIPFESPVDCQTVMDELISYRRKALPELLDRAQQAGVIIEYLHGAEGDVPTPELGWLPEMQDRVQAMHSLKGELDILGGYAGGAVAESLQTVAPKWLTELPLSSSVAGVGINANLKDLHDDVEIAP